MATAIVTPDQDAIVSEIEIAAPPERVFNALIDPAQLMQWWHSDHARPSTLRGRPARRQMALRHQQEHA
jgi:uncharacterized protein YndB with AHSA1/START domain